MSTVGRILGAAGIATGVIGAAALGGVTAQRRRVRTLRTVELEPGSAAAGVGDFDDLRPDRTYSVAAVDGTVLQVEEVGPTDAALTVVFAHGWTLRMGSWHFQRFGLTDTAGSGGIDGDDPELPLPPAPGLDEQTDGAADATDLPELPSLRMVFFDQRSHGRSSRGPADHATIDFLASDLRQVIDTAAPDAPVVLVGHSMGGMAILALAGDEPDWFAERVLGIGLICTGATYLRPGQWNKVLVTGGNPLVRGVASLAGRFPTVIERGRASSRDAAWLATRTFGFASPDVPAPLVDYLDEMITDTPADVIAEFAPGLLVFDRAAALPGLAGIPTVIIGGGQDRMTPIARSRAIADALPEARLVVVEGVGHVAMMEAPDVVNAAVRRLLREAAAYQEQHAEAEVAAR